MMNPSHVNLPCHNAIELLPWLLNGSLEAAERQALHAHLASCASCRAELEQTFDVHRLLTAHIPSLALAQYAHGRAPDGVDREHIERHLASCASCREEFEGMIADRIVAFPATPRRTDTSTDRRRAHRQLSIWRTWAVAASLVVVVGAGVLFRNVVERPRAAAVGQTAAVPAASAVLPAVVDSSEASGDVLFSDGFEQGLSSAWTSTGGLHQSTNAAPVGPQSSTKLPEDPWI